MEFSPSDLLEKTDFRMADPSVNLEAEDDDDEEVRVDRELSLVLKQSIRILRTEGDGKLVGSLDDCKGSSNDSSSHLISPLPQLSSIVCS